MRTYDFINGEVLLVNKPLGWTSFDAVNKLKYAFKPTKIKIGHAGTLDPLASGLLVICTGKMTKSIEKFQSETKTYTGTLVLGATTPSFDLETEIMPCGDYKDITLKHIEEICSIFIGKILQTPPIFSAIKKDGIRLYQQARDGKKVEIDKREIEIYSLKITRFEAPEVDFIVECSKGTYIRSLANDLGQHLGCGAYLSKLCRIRSGDLSLDNALDVSEWFDIIKDSQKAEIKTKT